MLVSVYNNVLLPIATLFHRVASNIYSPHIGDINTQNRLSIHWIETFCHKWEGCPAAARLAFHIKDECPFCRFIVWHACTYLRTYTSHQSIEDSTHAWNEQLVNFDSTLLFDFCRFVKQNNVRTMKKGQSYAHGIKSHGCMLYAVKGRRGEYEEGEWITYNLVRNLSTMIISHPFPSQHCTRRVAKFMLA